MNRRSLTKTLLIILLLQSVFVLILYVINTPPSRPAGFDGFIAGESIFILIAGIITVVLMLINVIANTKPLLSLKILSTMKCWFESSVGSYLTLGAVSGSYLVIGTGIIAVATNLIGPNRHLIAYILFTNSLPLLVLWFVSSLEVFILFTFFLGWELHLPNLSDALSKLVAGKSFGLFWLLSTITLSILHWLSLIFRWPIDSIIPLWYWQTTTKTGLRLWLVIPLALLFFTGYLLISNKNMPLHAKTIIVLVIGILFIVGFAAIEGSPYQVLYDKRYISGHRNYVAVAARNEGGTEFLYDYEAALGHDRFYATKPPGVYLTYRGLLAFGSLFFPHDTYQEKYDAINHSVMLLFPLLALSSIIIMEKLTRHLTNVFPPHLPGLLIIVVPNFLLLQGTIDQAIMPLLFLTGLYLGMIALKKSSWILSFLFGAFVYFCLYFSFSLLPLVMIFVMWILLEFWRNWNTNDVPGHLKLVTGSILGFGLSLVLMYLIFNYSPLVRYQNAMAIHGIQRNQPESIRDYLSMYLINNLEFATWIGIPLMITSFFAILKSSINFLWGRWEKIDSLMVSFLLTYVFLNHFGRTLSEVARLWLFIVPLICVFAVHFIQVNMKKKAYIPLFLLLQLITVVKVTQFILITWE